MVSYLSALWIKVCKRGGRATYDALSTVMLPADCIEINHWQKTCALNHSSKYIIAKTVTVLLHYYDNEQSFSYLKIVYMLVTATFTGVCSCVRVPCQCTLAKPSSASCTIECVKYTVKVTKSFWISVHEANDNNMHAYTHTHAPTHMRMRMSQLENANMPIL